jgi:hypothetical protein
MSDLRLSDRQLLQEKRVKSSIERLGCKILVLCIALISILLLELGAFAAPLPFAKGEHPRIFITKDDIPAIVAKLDDPKLKKRYLAMKGSVRAAVSKNWHYDTFKGPASPGVANRVVAVAFVWLIESYKHPDNPYYTNVYLNGVKQVLENMDPSLSGGLTQFLRSYSIAYDWVYNGLSPQDRITLGNKLMASKFVRQDINSPTLKGFPGNQGFPADSWHGAMMANEPSADWTYTAIAIWNETDLNGNADNSLAQDKLNQIRQFLTTKKIPFTNLVGGGLNPDTGYDFYGGTAKFAPEIYAWDKATGEDLWSASRFLQDTVIGRFHARKPSGGLVPGFCVSAYDARFPIEVFSAKDSTGIAQYIANERFKKGINRQKSYKENWWQYWWVIFYDPNKPATNYNTLPLAYYAQGYNADGTAPVEGLDAGRVLFRSGWTGNDTLISFTSGDWFTLKQRYDVNAFSIYSRGGNLAVRNSNSKFEGGVSGGANTVGGYNYYFEMNYGKPTIAFNTITVSDPNVIMDQGQEFWHRNTRSIDSTKPQYCCPNGIRSGGEAYRNESYLTVLNDHYRGSQYIDRGDIIKFETNSNYDYAVGDGSKAYHPQRLTNFQRALAFLDKKYLVVLDRVTATKPHFVKRWYLHTTYNEPTIPGTHLTDTSSKDGATTWSQDDFNNLIINGDRSGVPVGKEPFPRLFIKSLMPEGATYRKRGGKGFYFWRHDRSWNPDPGSKADISYAKYRGRLYPTNSDGGKSWRLEQDISGHKDDIFLNVLYPTDSTVTSMAETVRIYKTDDNIPTANMVGAHIKDSTENKVILFSSDINGATVTGNITYSVNPTANSKHFLFDLDPNSLSPALKYDITFKRTGTTQTITISPGSGKLSPSIKVLEHTDKGTLVFTLKAL